MGIRAIVVCVDYADLLAITLPRNMRFLDECVVVTSPADIETQQLCAGMENVRVFLTDAFYRHDAIFNKGYALEEGFDFLGREGWILGWDADIILPDDFEKYVQPEKLTVGRLYGARRYFVLDPENWTPDYDWKQALPSRFEVGIPGYFQLFNAADPHIVERPWHDITFAHAGGGDGYFSSRWPREDKQILPINVLHLGPRDCNWFGRASKRADGKVVEGSALAADRMDTYMRSKGWGRPQEDVSVGPDKVQVPGAKDTGFRLLSDRERRHLEGDIV